jgi:hypothetical protein
MNRTQIDCETLLAYTSWLAKHQRLTFTSERLVDAYMEMISRVTEEHAPSAPEEERPHEAA